MQPGELPQSNPNDAHAKRVCSDRFSYISAPIGTQINQPVVAPLPFYPHFPGPFMALHGEADIRPDVYVGLDSARRDF